MAVGPFVKSLNEKQWEQGVEENDELMEGPYETHSAEHSQDKGF
jgi:hypothetical protein